jgi:hypothetical protein
MTHESRALVPAAWAFFTPDYPMVVLALANVLRALIETHRGDFFTPPVIVGPYHRSRFVAPQIQGEFLGVQIHVINNPPEEVTIHSITC